MASRERDAGASDKERPDKGQRDQDRSARQSDAGHRRPLAGLQQSGAAAGDDGLSAASSAIGVLSAPAKRRQVDPRSLAALQRSVGNRATSRYVSARRPATSTSTSTSTATATATATAEAAGPARPGAAPARSGPEPLPLQRQEELDEERDDGDEEEPDLGLDALFGPSGPEEDEQDGGEGGEGSSFGRRMSGSVSRRGLERHRRALGGGLARPLHGVEPRRGPRPLRQPRPWQTERQERSVMRGVRRANARSGRRAMNRDRQHRLASFREEVSEARPEDRAAMWRSKGAEFKRRYS